VREGGRVTGVHVDQNHLSVDGMHAVVAMLVEWQWPGGSVGKRRRRRFEWW
jgi:hypothetical protein